MYQALYRKWRPKTFSDVVGQEHITATLRRQVAEGRLSHAYLFTGTRGTGKTTCAKILAKAVNCENPQDGDPCNRCPSCLGIDSGSFLDVTELDAASNNGVDNVRALRDEAVYSPAQVKKRVYIVDEVHMLTIQAFNALLKILEEPPEHLMFVLATTELHKVPATILSRCQRFSFRRILPRQIEARLDYVAKAEQIDLRPDGAELLSRLADGALRDALSLLDQCAAVGTVIDAAEVLDTLGLAGNVQTAQLLDCVLRHDAKSALLLFDRLYAGGKDVGSVLSGLSTLSRDLLISRTAPEGGQALLSGGYDSKTLQGLQALASQARLIQICTILQESSASLQNSINRRIDAELCLLRLCDEGLSGDLTALNARIARIEEQLAAGAAFAASSAVSAPAAEPVSAAPVIPTAPASPTLKQKQKAKTAAPQSEEPAPSSVPPQATSRTPDDLPPWESFDDAPPPPEDDDAPPVEAGPSLSAGPVAAAPSSAPQPAPPAPAAQKTEEDVFARLMESYKNRLPVHVRAFISTAKGRVNGDVLTVYCGTDTQKAMLDKPEVSAVLSEVTGQAIGQAITVRFVPGEPEGVPHDKMQDLIQISSSFSNFKIK